MFDSPCMTGKNIDIMCMLFNQFDCYDTYYIGWSQVQKYNILDLLQFCERTISNECWDCTGIWEMGACTKEINKLQWMAFNYAHLTLCLCINFLN
jgi:hypothetical protein